MKGAGPQKTDGASEDQPRSVAFHWLANIVLASLALFAGIAFGEKIPRDQMGTAFVAVAAVALALVPLTRYWEKTGIEGRRKAADQARLQDQHKQAPEHEREDSNDVEPRG